MPAKTLSPPLAPQRATGDGRVGRLRASAWSVGLLALGCSVVLALGAGDALAAQLPVSLGKAGSFAVLGGQTVTSTGLTTLNGDLGVSPGSSLTGFPPGKVNGTIHATDAAASRAQADLTAAYNDAAGRQPPQALPADVGGRTLAPGVYKTGATPALGLTGTLTLDGQGDPNAVFVIRVGSALTTAVTSHVNLIGRAQPGNVFWQIGSSATLGTSSTFAGSILALTSISIDSGVTLNGRALARNGAVTLIDDTINAPTASPPPPSVGGMTGFCIGSHTPIRAADRRPPARPQLLSPRGGGGGVSAVITPLSPLLLSQPHGRAGASAVIVRFSWRPAARAARYTLMVDHRRLNTGCRTSEGMRVSAGSHRFRVIAENRYGTSSSRFRAFLADPTSLAPLYGTRSSRSRAILAVPASLVPRSQCATTPIVVYSEREPIGPVRYRMKTRCSVLTALLGVTLHDSVSLYNTRPEHVGSSRYIRNQRVSGPFDCVSLLLGRCASRVGTYGPNLRNFTRHLVERIRTSDTLRSIPRIKRFWTPVPNSPQASACHGYFTRRLRCDYSVALIAPDHRCDKTPALNRDPDPAQRNREALYPNPVSPLKFVDKQGRVSRLKYGFTHKEPPPQPTGRFFFGFGYKKIAAKHGFGPEDVAATQTALDTHAGPALGRGDKRRVEYKGPVYDQNGTRCERIVAISYPFVNNRFGVGSIITSYGSSEADAPDPTQQ